MNLRLHEAIALGSMMIRPRGGTFGDTDSGCALGMGLIALGVPFGDTRMREEILLAKYPWLMDVVTHPCDCRDFCNGVLFRNIPTHVAAVIAHLFDSHVADGKMDWTMEQLTDWVRSKEPAGTEQKEEVTCHESQLVKQ